MERGKAGWFGEHVRKYHNAIKKQAEVVLLGDSLVANLSRYPSVWNQHLAPLNAANCGIGGDSARNVLWRVEHMQLPATVSVGVIHCGVNDINGGASSTAYGPQEIAENVITCGSRLQERHPMMSIIIMGILPAEETFWGRKSQIVEVNTLLKEYCLSRGFLFIEQVGHWGDPSSDDLNRSLYWRDGLHLSKKGCNMLAKMYADNIVRVKSLISPKLVTIAKKVSSAPFITHEIDYDPPHINNDSDNNEGVSESSIFLHRCHGRPRKAKKYRCHRSYKYVAPTKKAKTTKSPKPRDRRPTLSKPCIQRSKRKKK